jgi:hypothetical protein
VPLLALACKFTAVPVSPAFSAIAVAAVKFTVVLPPPTTPVTVIDEVPDVIESTAPAPVFVTAAVNTAPPTLIVRVLEPIVSVLAPAL